MSDIESVPVRPDPLEPAREQAYSVQPHPVASPPVPYSAPTAPLSRFQFDGGAGSYFLIGLVAAVLTLFTLGLATPWAACMTYRWRIEHTLIDGRRLRFTGTGLGLFGNWIKWWALTIVTLGIYLFWVYPRLVKWMTEKQTF